jgi:hypothetical protein
MAICRQSLPDSKTLSIPYGNLPFGNDGYDVGMTPAVLRKHLIALRFRNFQDLLRTRYEDSPQKFCSATGYDSPNIISQLKHGKKGTFAADLARQLELIAGLDRYELESESGIGDSKRAAPPRPGKDWPFSISPEEIMSLSGAARRTLDDTVTKIVLGSQAQDLLERQRKRKT